MTPQEKALPQTDKDYPVQPVMFTAVRVADAFWGPRMETNRTASIPHAFKKCEENGRIANFEIAAGTLEGEHRGDFPFDDTDPYKILEGASYALMLQPDPELDRYLDEVIAKIAGAQEPDGYLFTPRTNRCQHLLNWYKEERWINEARSHELYNAGHLYEAAAAHYLATGKRSLLEVALKNADLVDRTFGPGRNETPPGHQIIEMGLARLYRVTGERRYLDLAKFFLDARGRKRENGADKAGIDLWGEYNQDHKPVLEQDEAVGHAVRAVYMYAGMADVAALTGDEAYARAIDRLWENVVAKKYYITGGVGARGAGEAFGDNYELPNGSAYCETCAQIGHVYWNHRLFLFHGHAKYIDVLERTLYNSLISGVSMDGTTFFYPNPLTSQGQHERSAWFGCACCPGNVTRFMASLPGYAYAHRGDVLYVNLFLGSEAVVPMETGQVRVVQQTHYPWEGQIRLELQPEAPSAFKLRVRIPGWARNEVVPSDLYRYIDAERPQAVLLLNGAEVPVELVDGYAQIERTWQAGDVVELRLTLPVRRVVAHELVAEDRGRVAVERGPLVYCAEWPDNAGGHILNLLLPDDAPLQAEYLPGLLNGLTVVRGKCRGYSRLDLAKPADWEEQDLLLIPYYAWAHRGKGEMTVWLARSEAAVVPVLPPTRESAYAAESSNERDAYPLASPQDPARSSDPSVRFLHWWPRQGTVEWVQYDFPAEETVRGARVYWFDDTDHGNCRVPESWRILYRDGKDWKPVSGASAYGLEKDAYNAVGFDAVRTTGLRLEMQLRPGHSAGVQRWRLD